MGTELSSAERASEQRCAAAKQAFITHEKILPKKPSWRISGHCHWDSKEQQREAAILLFLLYQRIERGIDIF